MPSPSDEERYADIQRRIEQHRSLGQDDGTAITLADALDGLNAFGFLDDLKTRWRGSSVCYGPKARQGSGWAGVMVWFRQSGYYGYKTLTLFGIWAVLDSGQTQIIIGTKTLDFAAPVYNAESYQYQIKRGFKVYYGDDGSPPSTHARFYQTHYDPTQRLSLRRAIKSELDRWIRDNGADGG